MQAYLKVKKIRAVNSFQQNFFQVIKYACDANSQKAKKYWNVKNVFTQSLTQQKHDIEEVNKQVASNEKILNRTVDKLNKQMKKLDKYELEAKLLRDRQVKGAYVDKLTEKLIKHAQKVQETQSQLNKLRQVLQVSLLELNSRMTLLFKNQNDSSETLTIQLREIERNKQLSAQFDQLGQIRYDQFQPLLIS